MDDATKQGYGMMMLEQGLPKSHFYASAIARLKRDVARDVGPPVKPHLPFGVLGSGRDLLTEIVVLDPIDQDVVISSTEFISVLYVSSGLPGRRSSQIIRKSEQNARYVVLKSGEIDERIQRINIITSAGAFRPDSKATLLVFHAVVSGIVAKFVVVLDR